MLERPSRDVIQLATDAVFERIRAAENYWENFAVGGSEDHFDEELAKENLEEAWVLLLDLIRSLDSPTFFERAKRKFGEFEEKPLRSRWAVDEPYLVPASEARQLVAMIRDAYLGPKPSKASPPSLDRLIDVLRKSEHFITSRSVFGFLPSRELDVHFRIQGVLECAFDDVDDRPTLPSMGGIKSFEPDTAIKSLRVVIDYKFISDKPEGRTALDQIFADISGYKSEEYEHFIFVIYETTRAFSEHHWNAAIKKAGADRYASAIVLIGTPPSEKDKMASDALKLSKLGLAKAKKAGGAASLSSASATELPPSGHPA